MDKIVELRTKIDDIDDQIMSLLSQRYDLSEQIGTIKSNSKINILDTNREEYILKKIGNYNHSQQLELIYSTIMSESKNIQRR